MKTPAVSGTIPAMSEHPSAENASKLSGKPAEKVENTVEIVDASAFGKTSGSSESVAKAENNGLVIKDDELPKEIGGRDGPEPTRFGDWEKNGRCIDF